MIVKYEKTGKEIDTVYLFQYRRTGTLEFDSPQAKKRFLGESDHFMTFDTFKAIAVSPCHPPPAQCVYLYMVISPTLHPQLGAYCFIG